MAAHQPGGASCASRQRSLQHCLRENREGGPPFDIGHLGHAFAEPAAGRHLDPVDATLAAGLGSQPIAQGRIGGFVGFAQQAAIEIESVVLLPVAQQEVKDRTLSFLVRLIAVGHDDSQGGSERLLHDEPTQRLASRRVARFRQANESGESRLAACVIRKFDDRVFENPDRLGRAAGFQRTQSAIVTPAGHQGCAALQLAAAGFKFELVHGLPLFEPLFLVLANMIRKC